MNFHNAPDQRWLVSLLTQCNLPTDDIADLDLNWFIGGGALADPWGVVGLEVYGDIALLRSLAVIDNLRGTGRGQALVMEVERQALQAGITELYLLTETAATFFGALDYHAVQRDKVPYKIATTRQFSSLCPDTALVMCKQLKRD